MSSIPYSIERTRNRSSRAILKGDAVHIRLARGLSVIEEQEHIETLLRRMTKAFVREQKRTPIDPFRPLREGAPSIDLTLVTGMTVSIDNRKYPWRRLSHAARAHIDRLVQSINDETLRVPVRAVRLRFMRSRWGSCSHRGIITLSTPLLFTSPAILRYVIIHELAHMIHPDHSVRFWRTVEAHEPDYRELVAELKNRKLPVL